MLPTLTTPRLCLRPFTLDDANSVQALAGAYEVAANTLTMPHPYKDGMAEEWIASHESAWNSGASLTLAIALSPQVSGVEHSIIGAIGLGLCPEHQRAGLGYWLGVPYWNQGYMTEAARAVVSYGFETLDLNRIEAGHYGRNPASGRAMQKIGMTQEGIQRQHVYKWGQFEDLILYGLLASDWQSGISDMDAELI